MNSFIASTLSLVIMLWLAACAGGSSGIVAADETAAPVSAVLSANQIEMAGFKESTIASRNLAGYRPLQRVLVMLADENQVLRLQKIAPGVEFVGSPGVAPGDDVKGPFDAIILVCGRDAALDYAENVAWIHSYSAGVENCLAHPRVRAMDAANKDYIITNSSGTAASIIGEHAIAMMMSFSRGLHHFRDAQNQGLWNRNFTSESAITTTVGGKTMLVLGLGSIGKEVARRANALGMRVIATRNSSRSGPDYVDYVGLSDETLELASQADVIVNALPLTDSTRGLLDTAFFNAMKNSALLISVGRGGTTNTDDLLAALEAGQLAGAALDVTDPEPLPAGHPLWQQKNVIITPHLAGTGGDARAKVYALLLENVRRYQAGEPLINPVSSKAGY
ncbi:MAG: D-2-hydroxyacid dehydrogenase [Gammaproteobacteria bacterium]|nr:D-2-hydroxyacid dehydrogenase [Gammaproteobacteria bacterium]